MANYMCSLWTIVLRKPKIPGQVHKGQILNNFLVDKPAAIEHLLGCVHCQQLYIAIDPPKGMMPRNTMNDEEFKTVIQDLWDLARNQ